MASHPVDPGSATAAAAAGLLPRQLDIPVQGGEEDYPISLDEVHLPEFTIEDVNLVLREERASPHFWTAVACEMVAAARTQDAHAILAEGCQVLQGVRDKEPATVHALYANLVSRRAASLPKTALADARYQNLQGHATKDAPLTEASTNINAALRIAASTSRGVGGGRGGAPPSPPPSVLLSHAALLGVTGRNDQALELFERVLRLPEQSLNPAALLGKACCLLRRRQYEPALKLYQLVLRIALAHDQRASRIEDQQQARTARWAGPDPRVGIGLCLHGLGHVVEARRAWSRAAAVDADNAPARLLLGLSAINLSRQAAPLPRGVFGAGESCDEAAARESAYREGILHVQAAWKLDNRNAMAAVALCEHIAAQAARSAGARGTEWAKAEFAKALKLGEHAVQYADSRSAVVLAWAMLGRAAHLASYVAGEVGGGGSLVAAPAGSAVAPPPAMDVVELRSLAQRAFSKVVEDFQRNLPIAGSTDSSAAAATAAAASHHASPVHLLAFLGLAQLQTARGEDLAAMNTLEGVLGARGAVGGVGASNAALSVSSSASASAMTHLSSLQPSASLEVMLLEASLKAHSHPGAGAAERASDRARARLLLERTMRVIESARAMVEAGRAAIKQGGADGVDAASSSSLEALAQTPPEQLQATQATLAREGLGARALREVALLGDDALAYAQLAELLQSGGASADLSAAAKAYANALRVVARESNEASAGDASGKPAPPTTTTTAMVATATAAAKATLRIRLTANLGAVLALRGIEAEGDEVRRSSLTGALHFLQEALRLAGEAGSTSSSAAPGGAAAGVAGATAAAGGGADALDAEKTVVLYSLGRAFEALGSRSEAQQAYRTVLGRHPEYVDAKVCLAMLLASSPSAVDSALVPAPPPSREATLQADALFKEALASEPSNLDARASYVCFLGGSLAASPSPPQWGAIKDLAAQLFWGASPQGVSLFGSANAARAVQDEARSDPFTLASLGWAYYQLGLATKPGPNQRKERARSMARAVELFDKALASDARCAFAAQGLAVLCAEGALAELSGTAGGGGADTAAVAERRRKEGAELALTLLSKLSEVRDDGSVEVCVGHACMIKEDFQKALDAYELAARRLPDDTNVLQYLARAEYALGLGLRSYAHLERSLRYLARAQELLESRRAAAHQVGHAARAASASAQARYARYNAAVTRQKALQMLLELERSKERRTLAQLEDAVEGMKQAQSTFAELLPDAQRGQLLYISAEVVEQRQQYGESSLLRQAARHVAEQRDYEESLRAEREAQAAQRREREEARERERREEEERRRDEMHRVAEQRRREVEEARERQIRLPSPEYGVGATGGGGRAANGGGGKKGGRRRRKADEGGSEIETDEDERAAAYGAGVTGDEDMGEVDDGGADETGGAAAAAALDELRRKRKRRGGAGATKARGKGGRGRKARKARGAGRRSRLDSDEEEDSSEEEEEEEEAAVPTDDDESEARSTPDGRDDEDDDGGGAGVSKKRRERKKRSGGGGGGASKKTKKVKKIRVTRREEDLIDSDEEL